MTNGNVHAGDAKEASDETPRGAARDLTQNDIHMLNMLQQLQRLIMAGEVLGVSYVVVRPDRTPQTAYVTSQNTAPVLAGGHQMAIATLIDYARGIDHTRPPIQVVHGSGPVTPMGNED